MIPVNAAYYLSTVLSQEQQGWLANDIVTRPRGVEEFANTLEGKRLVRQFFEAYRLSRELPASVELQVTRG